MVSAMDYQVCQGLQPLRGKVVPGCGPQHLVSRVTWAPCCKGQRLLCSGPNWDKFAVQPQAGQPFSKP